MKTSAQGKPGFKTAHAAFSITEVLVAISIVGVLFLSLYGGITSGFAVVNLARETCANQIVLEKMETIRLYTWDQINSNGFIAPTFTASFYPPLPVGGESTRSNTDSTSRGQRPDLLWDGRNHQRTRGTRLQPPHEARHRHADVDEWQCSSAAPDANARLRIWNAKLHLLIGQDVRE